MFPVIRFENEDLESCGRTGGGLGSETIWTTFYGQFKSCK